MHLVDIWCASYSYLSNVLLAWGLSSDSTSGQCGGQRGSLPLFKVAHGSFEIMFRSWQYASGIVY